MSHRRSPIGSDTLERTRYFSRQVVTPPDLAQDREYLLHRHRRHNRLLHGWGIVLGLDVGIAPLPGTDVAAKEAISKFESEYCKLDGVDTAAGTWVGVKAGYAITPSGDEVYLSTGILANTVQELNQALVTQPAGCRSDLAPRSLERKASDTFYLIVEATESEARPVRAAGNRCGDHPDQFEFSRLRDGIQFRLVAAKDLAKPVPTAQERLTGNLIKPNSDIIVLKKVEFAAGKIKTVTTDGMTSTWTPAGVPTV